MEHYRCYKIYIPEFCGEQDSETVHCFLRHGTVPFLSSADLATYAALDLIAAIKNPHLEVPFYIGDDQLHALTELADIFASFIVPKIIPANTASPHLLNHSNPLEKPRVPPDNNNKPRVDNKSTPSPTTMPGTPAEEPR